MWSVLERFGHDDRGASALEYGLVVTLISLVIIGGATLAGNGLGMMFNYIGSQLSNIAP